ncbi:hypothetical protein [Oceanobacillus sp. CAU 1775]
MVDQKLLEEIAKYVEFHINVSLNYSSSLNVAESSIFTDKANGEIENYIKTIRKPPLNAVLFKYIDKKTMSDSQVYKKAGIDRRHFSKIRSNSDYKPKKNTIIALAFALELNRVEFDEVLSAAGYSLAENDTNDLIIQYFLDKEIYDIPLINEVLESFELKPLGQI